MQLRKSSCGNSMGSVGTREGLKSTIGALIHMLAQFPRLCCITVSANKIIHIERRNWATKSHVMLTDNERIPKIEWTYEGIQFKKDNPAVQ